jgi:hypothetical protein
MSEKWKARPVPEEPIQLFVGILSATNHFAERMAIRKTWMQFPAIQLGNVVARFFVALVRLVLMISQLYNPLCLHSVGSANSDLDIAVI